LTLYVVDASVAAKWFIPERRSEFARRLISSEHRRVAPDFIFLEFANVLTTRHRRNEISAIDASRNLRAFAALIEARESTPFIPAALEIAMAFTRSAYDALYVALAISEGCQLVTADRRLHNALAPHLPETMLWIEDVPLPAG
jgi:predicted nucleic acid-binding protein